MMSENPGLVEALEPVANALHSMDVSFYVGGLVASSYHIASRSTLDVDLVADLKRKNVDLLVDKLQNEYYMSGSAIIDAIERCSCFNLIHLSSSFKVDVFIPKNRDFDKISMTRAKLGKIDSRSEFEVPIASPEDTILSKLEWYRLGNEASERQWDDVVRVMKVLGDHANHEYLMRNAVNLNVADLLQKLLALGK